MSNDGIIVSCRCGQRFKAELWLAGRNIPCPFCKQTLVVGPAPQKPVQFQEDDAIAVACVCGQRFAAAPKLWGHRVKCPNCGNQLRIPSSPPAVSGPSTHAALNRTFLDAAATPSENILENSPSPQNLYYPNAPTTYLPSNSYSGNQEKPIDSRWVVAAVGLGIGAVTVLLLLMLVVDPFLKTVADNKQRAGEVADDTPATTITPDPANTSPATDGNSEGQVSPPVRFSEEDSSAGSSMSSSGAAESAGVDPPQTTPNPNFAARAVTSAGRDSDQPGARSSAVFGDSPNPDTASRLTVPLNKGLLQWINDTNQQRAGLRRVGAGGHPIEQFSWMCELLPLMGEQKTYDQLDFGESWNVAKNVKAAHQVIPQFLNPADDRSTWEGYPFNGFALTHFVGMSGIEDKRNDVAASLPRSDPRAGVFGYDRVAAPDEITDGTSNTLMVIGSGDIKSPWIQGGGATVRGARAPYFGKITGFGSRGTRDGAIAVTADGSVRLVSSKVDPKVFRAMCTIHGAENIDLEHIPAFDINSVRGR